MKSYDLGRRRCLTLLCAAAAAAVLSGPALAATKAKPATAATAPHGVRGDTWMSIGQQPDFSTGVWMEPLDIGTASLAVKNELPSLTPAYQAKADAARKSNDGGYGKNACAPRGVPAIMRIPYAKKFLFEPKGAYIFIEGFMQMRFIYMDGRKHPPEQDLLPTFNGHSIGHWEGDTFVVDTIGFVDTTPLVNINTNLLPVVASHSEKMHVVERFRLISKNVMETVTTVTDPIALTKPWVVTARLERMDRDLEEFECENPLDLNSIK